MKKFEELLIHSNTVLLHRNLFDENQNITSITIFSIQDLSIPNDVFNNCKHLRYIKFGSNSTITMTEDNFYQFYYIRTIELGGNKVIIKDNCFNECVNMKKNNIEENFFIKINSSSYVEIGNNCFNNLLYLESIEIDSSKIIIKSSCFNSCDSLLSCSFSKSSDILIGKFCFNECHKIEKILFSNANYIEIGVESFIRCNSNTNLSITPSTSIDTIKIFEKFQQISEGKYFQTFTIQKDTKSDEYITNAMKNENITVDFQNDFFKRMALLSRMNYSGIIPFIGYGFITLNSKCMPSIFCEKFQNYTLYHFLREKAEHSLTSMQKYTILIGIAYGIQYLHSLNINLSNLTINNIFLDEKCFPYIFDYGLFNEMKPNNNVSAEEKFKKDIYLYSLVMYELFTGRQPIDNDSENNININLKYITNTKIQELFRRIWLFDSLFVPPIDDIFKSIKKEENRNLFLVYTKEIPIFSYIKDAKDTKEAKDKKSDKEEVKSDEEFVIQNVNNIIFKLNKTEGTSKIISSPHVTGKVFIPKYIEFESKKYLITNICKKAFSNSSIKSLSFSLNSIIKHIEDSAFSKSTLQKLYLPASLVKLERFWCEGAENLSEIEIDINNSNFLKKDEVLYCIKKTQIDKFKDSTFEIVFVPRSCRNKFIIQPETTFIGSFAFYRCNNIEYIESQSKSLETDEYSFYQCENLKSISFNDSSSLSIKTKSFYNLNNLNTLTIQSQHLTFEENWIKDCPSLEKIIIDVSKEMQFIPLSFNDFESLLNIELISKSSFIFNNNCFSKLKQLTTIKIKAQQIIFNENWSEDCPNLEKIVIEIYQDFTVTSNIFSIFTSLKKIKIVSESQLTIKEKSFNLSENLKSINLKATKIIIENECFSSSKNLTKVKISCNELTIGYNCFSNCINMTSISFDNIQTITISSKAFELCSNLKEFCISALLNIKLSENCFNGSTNIQKVELNSKKIVIGSNCFKECNKLSSISFKNAQILIIGSHSFERISKLESICINALKKIDVDDFCFSESENLQTVTFDCEELNVGCNCFDKCHNLKTISFKNIKSSMLGSFAFNECTSITEFKVNILENLIISNKCFFGADHLQSVDLECNFITIGSSVFENCSSLKSVNIKYKNNFVSANAFDPKLKTVIKFLPK